MTVLHSSTKVSLYRKKDELFLPYTLRWKNNLFIVKMYQDFSSNWASHHTTQKSGDLFEGLQAQPQVHALAQ